MKKKSLWQSGCCIVLLVTFAIIIQQRFFVLHGVELVPHTQKYKKQILLVPLDSRPPCQKFVIDAGRLVDFKVTPPPQAYLDYYTESGQTKQLAQWVLANVQGKDAIIISADQMLYGGLLASRKACGRGADLPAFIALLQELRQAHPDLPIYVFNILPRLTPPADIDDPKVVKALMEYSRLQDRLSLPLEPAQRAALTAKLQRATAQIPPAALMEYLNLYKKNTQLNEKLIDLAAQQIITKLVIGQDDGEEYGIPNIEKRRLRAYCASHQLSQQRVFITHGADEVAMSMLVDLQQQLAPTHWQLKVFVAYDDQATSQLILPYMAATLAETVEEKLALANARQVDIPQAADFILYVHAGDTQNLSLRQKGALQIKQWLAEQRRVAVVDLSKHFAATETLFPIMVQHHVPLNQLIAYSGWNTASNSIGTAVAQASLYCWQAKHLQSADAAWQLAYNNLTILYQHFVEDYFYLKGTIDGVNVALHKAGINNVNDLDMDNNYKWANYMVQTSLACQLNNFAYSKASFAPVAVFTPDGRRHWAYIRDLQVNAFYPWPRTFEIYTTVQLNLYTKNERK